jgi:hypothetical protein
MTDMKDSDGMNEDEAEGIALCIFGLRAFAHDPEFIAATIKLAKKDV